MKSRGVDFRVISSPGDMLDKFGEREHVPFRAVPMERRITPLKDLRSLWALVRALKEERAEIVHAHTPKGGLLGMISSWIAPVPVRIYHIRGLPYLGAAGKKRTLMMWTERISCRLAHRVFCVSHSIREVAIRDGICPSDKIVVFGGGSGNGVDADISYNPDRFDASARRRLRDTLGIPLDVLVIGFVGRIVRDKGIHELATAWRSLRCSHPTAHLVLAGNVEPQDPVDPEVLAILKEDDRVHLLGSVEDTSEIFAIIDLLVLPTYREGFPNVPLEAAAMQVPVVATRIPGCIDAVDDGKTGTLVLPHNAEQLHDAIVRYLDDQSLRQRHGRAGRRRVLQQFRQEAIWEAMFQEYEHLLSDARINRR